LQGQSVFNPGYSVAANTMAVCPHNKNLTIYTFMCIFILEEKNQKKKNRREYEKGDMIKNIMLGRRK
jgi:hypothetical protein